MRDPTLWKINSLSSECTRTELRPREVLRESFFGERLCDFFSARIFELKVYPAIIRSSAPCNLHLIPSQRKRGKVLIESVYGVDKSSERALKLFFEKRLDLDKSIAYFARRSSLGKLFVVLPVGTKLIVDLLQRLANSTLVLGEEDKRD